MQLSPVVTSVPGLTTSKSVTWFIRSSTILDHLDVRASPLPRAPARDPDWKQVDLGFEGFDAA
jgi:hypothetical protein